MIIYTVKSGDSLYSIARNYGVTLGEIERFNQLPNPERLIVGQTVLIPVEGSTHEVESGESLYSIALHHNITLDEIIKANPNINPPYTIYAGQIINVPERAQKKTISVNGYAYPSINRTTLQQTLPYLTYLSIFSHSVNSDGTLNSINDDELISLAKQGRTAPIMVITNTEEGAGFSSDIAHSVLTNNAVKNTLINNVITQAKQKGYMGVDVDFEYIYPNDRDNYNAFLQELGQRLREQNLTLSTAVAPKLSATQKGTLYEAHDYAFHGSVVDYMIIMTYEWGYMYGPPLAVAPYNEVRKVISYAVTEIESSKILMGMPNYGYDWTLPYIQGRPAEILSINGAVQRAANVGAEILYNKIFEAPFYEYTQNGAQHIVWFENALSTAARLSLVNDFNLGGVSYWTVNQFYAQNWRVLENMFNVRKVL
jgi:spore germination protein